MITSEKLGYRVEECTFDSARDTWQALLPLSATNTIFLTPGWQQVWWRHFQDQRDLMLLTVHQGDAVVGVAPMTRDRAKISLVGSKDVCDYLDFVVPEAHTSGALSALFDHLDPLDWRTLVLHSLPGESPTLPALQRLAQERGYTAAVDQEDVCPRMDLPGDWETYLGTLRKKDRHELRRKLRRLEGAGEVRYYAAGDPASLDQDMTDFFRLHRMSMHDKAAFMDAPMEAFFREMMSSHIGDGTGRLLLLEVDGQRAAAIFCFDYSGKRLLYNSGYDPQFSSLSVGLLLKAHAIRDAIECGMSQYD
ncbi:MAG: GNAT family N-acetyltransferase, partial [Chloroflexota bacterium]